MIEDGKKVSIEYTLKLDDGSTVDSNVSQAPLVYTQGGNQILPALERALVGLKVDDTKTVNLSAEDGYGPVDANAFHEVEIDVIPEESRTVGETIVARDDTDVERLVRVLEVKDDKIVLDFNHPLAGENLTFQVKVVAVE